MQKIVLGVLFLFLLGGVSALLYKLYAQNTPLPHVLEAEPKDRVVVAQESPEAKAWVKELALHDTRPFRFPVNELFMQIAVREGDGSKVKSFRLVIDRIDRYSLFCIVQILSQYKLPYMLIKEEKAPLIYVQEKSEKALEGVVSELEKYDIKSKIVEVWL